MPDDLRHKTIAFFDLSGSYTHLAEAVVPDFARVLYWVPWQSRAFPVIQEFAPGLGLEGIERIVDFEDHLDDIDLVVFPDVGMGGLQEYLRRQGLLVLGSGHAGILERDRWLLHERLKNAGLEPTEGEYVIGLDALRLELAQREECYIKTCLFRGNIETMHQRTYETFRGELDHHQAELGPLGQVLGFLVEEPIGDDECVEVGFDDHFGNANYAGPTLWGYECKDLGFLGFASELLPLRLEELREKTAHLVAPYNYCGPISIEARITKNRAVFLDLTARYGSPPSEIQAFLIENLGEVMWAAAQGSPIAPVFRAPVAAQLVITSETVGEKKPIQLDVGMPERTALHGHFKIGGKDCIVSPSAIKECAGAVGLGSSIEDAFTEAIEAAGALVGVDLKYEESALSKALEAIEKGITLGLDYRAAHGGPGAADRSNHASTAIRSGPNR
jgi:hypothetical protein